MSKVFSPNRVPAGLATLLAGLFVVASPGCTSVPSAVSDSARVEPMGPDQTTLGTTREFEADELYRLLVAEFAAKRGDMPLAIENYLAVARSSKDVGVVERAVRLSIYGRDEANGLGAAKMWTDIAPQDSEGHRVYGALLLRSGQVESAVTQFEKLIALGGEDNDLGFESVGELLARERDRDAALEAMRKLLTGRESNVHALYAYATLAARAGEVDQSLDLLRQLLVVDPNHDRAAVLYARLLQQKGNLSDALNSLAAALEQNPSAEGVRLTYARLLVDAKRYEDARAQFERLLTDTPDNVEVRYMLGLLLLQTTHLEEARTHFERLTSTADLRLAAHYYLGQIAESTEELERALLEYREVDEGEHFLGAQIRVAVILAEQGKIEDARGHLQSLPRENAQQDIQIYRAEAEVLAKSNELESAMQVYDEALTEYAENPDLLYARAMLAEKLDRLDVLEGDLRTILEREPDNADALNALGFTLADRTERYEEALQLISRALELKPDDYYILDSMGWVLYRVGRHKEALEYLRRALSLNEDPEVAAHLGEVLWVSGDKDAAREVWSTALKITPDDERLLEVINRFTD